MAVLTTRWIPTIPYRSNFRGFAHRWSKSWASKRRTTMPISCASKWRRNESRDLRTCVLLKALNCIHGTQRNRSEKWNLHFVWSLLEIWSGEDKNPLNAFDCRSMCEKLVSIVPFLLCLASVPETNSKIAGWRYDHECWYSLYRNTP